MKVSYLFFLLLLHTGLAAQLTLERVIDDFVTSPALEHATVGIAVREVASGRQIAGRNAELSLIPASTQKLLTTAAAMDLLGADYRFRTRLVAGGDIDAGTLTGDLFIIGGGDPTLGSPYMDGVADLETVLENWVAAIQERGIRRITGAIVGDGSYYGTAGTGRGWPWSDLGNYYGAGVHGLNLNENAYYLSFTQRPAQGSTPPVSGTDPAIPGLRFINELRSGPANSGDNAYIFGAPYNYDHYVRGTIPRGSGQFRIRGAIPDPPLLAAQLLREKLTKAGIRVDEPATCRRLFAGTIRNGEQLLETFSPTLAEIADRTNMRSVNLYAEGLLREMNKAAGTPAHELDDTDVIVDWLEKRGLPTSSVRLRDGSGLDPRNFFSPSFMTAFLVDRAGAERWLETIPVAGRSGSLRNTLRGTAAEGRVRAKSGTVNAVRAYAGYVDRPDGQRLAFSVVVNNYSNSSLGVSQLLYGLMRDLVTARL
ncbi:D-alanyl-D-alanine carboxypeptidase/D-alanyl-D-alanine-endopeptidase (penicillin-binding protein 4) [Neolewinella xylanilytica]|uniref:D-alanyl-D-alanine carboxypeptidase/D-alanyl-D-alanine-endopeptidase (Penicillin-binding protein 4) n=1 Tax=Neolewinella xylanilytica TaxID=1514080 RepID=A0A2S6I7J9_9BACT|nr:D-alanyl-D-alanine carboxypeptidase/D-alanyl-D-alanine-endopeptidase [Neolewinella xylanilytica]PPK87409.1 D-alanyl-D-alanine carboxypeptidase/D-alanyl-D-alanine-endopeptidase (penicillin-binding protein 4) [Neolewinella xylanilytica]